MQRQEYMCNLHKNRLYNCVFWINHQIQKTYEKGVDKQGKKW